MEDYLCPDVLFGKVNVRFVLKSECFMLPKVIQSRALYLGHGPKGVFRDQQGSKGLGHGTPLAQGDTE